ncbi:MAG: MFS transporter [Candidatus Rariloculaceae bacterium]
MLSRVLQSRNFAIYLAGSTFSLHGLWIQRVAIGWLAWELTNSEVWLGLIALSEFLPTVFLGPFFGVWADRLNRKTVAFVATLSSIALSSLLFALTALDLMDIYLLWVITAFVGIVGSAFQPVRMSLIPSLIPRDLLSEAVAAQSIVFNISRFVGPALAGVAIATMGLASAFALNTISYLAMIAALLLIELRTKRSGGVQSDFFAELRDGIAYTFQHRKIRQQLLIVALSALFGRAIIVMLPAYAGGVFGGGSSELATLTSVSGAGAIFAGIYLTRLGAGARLLRTTVVATLLSGLLMAGLGVTDSYIVGIVVVAGLSFVLTLVGIGSQSLIQTQVDEAMRGRVLSLWAAVAFSAPAIGSVIIGVIADRFGVGPVTFVSGLLCAFLALLLTVRVFTAVPEPLAADKSAPG